MRDASGSVKISERGICLPSGRWRGNSAGKPLEMAAGMNDVKSGMIERIVREALEEDLRTAGDITSTALFSPEDTAAAVIISKSTGVISGMCLVEPLFRGCDDRLAVDLALTDGAPLEQGTRIAAVSGPIRGILAGERTVLNFLQHLGGVATLASRYAAAIAHTSCRLLDTRKTMPLLRLFEKEAVVHGGGANHRFGLFDMLLIKDTHVKRSGGVATALRRAFDYRRNAGAENIKIEIEVQSVEEFSTALALHPDRIMLDNMTVEAMRTCAALRKGVSPRVELEASGNVTLATIAGIAETGVDFISVGALTHSAPALDIHLVIQ